MAKIYKKKVETCGECPCKRWKKCKHPKVLEINPKGEVIPTYKELPYKGIIPFWCPLEEVEDEI